MRMSVLHQKKTKEEVSAVDKQSGMDDIYVSEEMQALMPDYPVFRRSLFLLESWMVVAISFLELVMFFLLYSTHMIKETMGEYLLLYLFLPMVSNCVILAVTYWILQHVDNMAVKNSAPIIGVTAIGMVACFTHGSFACAMCIFCIPVVMCNIFSAQRLCHIICAIGTVGIVLASVKYFFFNTDMSSPWLFFEALIAIAFLWFFDGLSQILISLIQGQKEKIFTVATKAKEAQEIEKAANNAKSEFLANMSHEMRTPINAVLGMNEMILREAEEDQLKEYAANIQSAGNSLLLLINDILDISKIESGKMEIEENVYETASFIHDICNLLEERAREKGLYLKVNCDENTPSCLRGDEMRIRQIVVNLLTNAIKYTPKGEVVFTVNQRRDEEGFFLILSVRDTGIGIKPENLEKLFSQFQRFDSEKNKNIEGTGLGLAITKQLVELMHGKIEVNSVYGVGTEFIVTIPQGVADEKKIGDFHRNMEAVRTANSQYQKSFEAPRAHILVVDDVEMNLKVIYNLLKFTKVQIDTATSGAESLEKMKCTPYDIIFMDHLMRGMDGIETFHKLKEMADCPNVDTPVIMLTANALSGMKEQYLNEGFAGYLSKPVRGTDLEEMILKFLPPEKVESVSQEAEQAVTIKGTTASKENMLFLQNVYQVYPEIDVPLGLSYCNNNAETFVDIIQAYAEGKQVDMLDDLYTREDWKNYLIQSHALKVTFLSMGLKAASDMADLLEGAAHRKAWDELQRDHSKAVKEFKNIQKILRSGLAM